MIWWFEAGCRTKPGFGRCERQVELGGVEHGEKENHILKLCLNPCYIKPTDKRFTHVQTEAHRRRSVFRRVEISDVGPVFDCSPSVCVQLNPVVQK